MSDQFESAKRASLGQVLLKVTRLYETRALDGLSSQMDPVLISARKLLPYLPFEGGIRQTELAQKVGVSKQAVGVMLRAMDRAGYLTRVVDPQDARARLVMLTPQARIGMSAGLACLEAVRGELTEALGEARIARVHDDLLAILSVLEAEQP